MGTKPREVKRKNYEARRRDGTTLVESGRVLVQCHVAKSIAY